MTYGIGDGYYETSVPTTVIPLPIHWRHDGVHIMVRTPEDVESLADALLKTSEDCQESFGTMRV